MKQALLIMIALLTAGSSRDGANHGDDYSYSVDLYQEAPGGADSKSVGFGTITCRYELWGTVSGPNLSAEVSIRDPNGTTVASQVKQTYSYRLSGSFSYKLPDASGGTYSCQAAYVVDGQFLGEPIVYQAVTPRIPTSLTVFQDYYIWQEPNNYTRQRDYQVKDQSGFNWNYQNFPVTESIPSWSSNGCLLPDVTTGSGATNTQGTYSDYYSMSGSPVCSSNPSCVSSTSQTVYVAGYQVAQMSLDYGCNGVSISQP